MPAILPTSASAPLAGHDHGAAAVGDRRVHERHVPLVARAELVRRCASDSFEAGVLSPVSADSSMLSELASMIRPSAATLSPAVISTMSPRTTSSTGICRLDPSRRTRAVCLVRDLQRVHCALGLALLAEPDRRRCTPSAAGATTPVLHLTDGQRQDGGDDQDDLHVARVLRPGTAASRAHSPRPAGRSGRRASRSAAFAAPGPWRVDVQPLDTSSGVSAYQSSVMRLPPGLGRVRHRSCAPSSSARAFRGPVRSSSGDRPSGSAVGGRSPVQYGSGM